jgi:hypothetical protein
LLCNYDAIAKTFSNSNNLGGGTTNAIPPSGSVMLKVLNGAWHVVSRTPGAGGSHWSDQTGIADSIGLPNGVNDLIENVRREGRVGIKVNPSSALHTTSFAAAAIDTSSGAYNPADDDYLVRLNNPASQTVNFPAAGDQRIYKLLNPTAITKVSSTYIDFAGLNSTVIPANSSSTFQRIGGTWHLTDRSSISATTPIVRAAVICRNKTVQSINNWTTLTGWTEIQDPTNSFDATTGLFIAPRAGLYDFSLGNGLAPALNAYYGLCVIKSAVQLYNVLKIAATASTHYECVSGTIELAANEQLYPRGFHAAAANDVASASNSWFTVMERPGSF